MKYISVKSYLRSTILYYAYKHVVFFGYLVYNELALGQGHGTSTSCLELTRYIDIKMLTRRA